jgi:hypothetical protein
LDEIGRIGQTSRTSQVNLKFPIEKLNSPFSNSENNAELQRAMATHSENLKLLSMPLSDLTLQICGDFINPGPFLIFWL